MVSHLHPYFPKNLYSSWAFTAARRNSPRGLAPKGGLEPFLLQFVEWDREFIVGSFRFWDEDDYEYEISQY